MGTVRMEESPLQKSRPGGMRPLRGRKVKMSIRWNTQPAARMGCRPTLPVLILGLAVMPLFGQSAEDDVKEVDGFAGGSFGAGSRGAVGAGAGVALSRHGLALLEGMYMPLGREILWRRSDIQRPQDSYLLDLGLSFQIRLPVGDRRTAYGIIGSGLLYNAYRAPAGTAARLTDMQDFKGEFHTGAGLHYYVGDKWGIRPEVKVIISSRTFATVSMGVFYVLPSYLP